MKTVQLHLPEALDIKEHELAMIVAAKLYEEARLSAGQAAQVAGLSKRAFLEMLGKYGVSVLSTSVDDLHNDIANA